MICLDTNVLVRYLMQDDAEQAATADEVMDGLSQSHPGFISIVVLAELSWVLTSAYRLPTNEVLPIVESLLSSDDVRVQQPDVVRRAVGVARGPSGDFADALIGCLGEAEGCSTTVTFDRRAARAPQMSLAGGTS